MNKLFKLATILIIALGLSACGSSDDTKAKGGGKGTRELPAEVVTALSSQKSTLSQDLTNTIAYMGNEERLAYDVYNYFSGQYGTKQFTNIASNSEYLHISAIQQLVQKYVLNDDVNFTNVDLPSLGYVNTPITSMQAGTYDIATIQALYDNLISQGSASEIEALKVGCMVEVIDINDLNNYINLSTNENASDLVIVFNYLRNGSYKHYWAFDKGLVNQGLNGCCSVGTVDGINYCHPEYPQ